MPEPSRTSEERARECVRRWVSDDDDNRSIEGPIADAIDAAVAEQRSAYLAASRKSVEKRDKEWTALTREAVALAVAEARRAALVAARMAVCCWCAGKFRLYLTDPVEHRGKWAHPPADGSFPLGGPDCTAARIVALIEEGDSDG